LTAALAPLFCAVPRHLVPELLDSLPPDHPDALRSRRDLVRVNRIMGNARWFARTLASLRRPGESALELGAGDGTLALALHAAGLTTDALDRVPAPAAWPASARWHTADLRAFAHWGEYPLVIGNLILHHFTDDELSTLGPTLRQHARVLLFNEPHRARRFRWLWAVAAPLGGANFVTRHDGRVSIAAGFVRGELPRLLGLDHAAWDCREETSLLGAYRLIAIRRP
jgi:hypothetical protein